jgi:bisanhydrobacterioruberin hydratase
MFSYTQTRDLLHQHILSIKIFFVIFYSVGIAGLIIPVSSPWFMSLIPLALLLSFFFLALYHEHYSKRLVVFFLVVYLTGFAVEVLGVHTHLLFGEYRYGANLGIKVLDTPLMIGLNWVLLVYLTAAVTNYWNWPPAVKILIASAMMLVYDLVLEQVAPALDMWHWQQGEVPLKNYGTWLIMAVVFHTAARLFHIKINNRLATVILFCQFLFLLALFILLKPVM